MITIRHKNRFAVIAQEMFSAGQVCTDVERDGGRFVLIVEEYDVGYISGAKGAIKTEKGYLTREDYRKSTEAVKGAADAAAAAYRKRRTGNRRIIREISLHQYGIDVDMYGDKVWPGLSGVVYQTYERLWDKKK